jgi:hypothetical protein
MFLRIAEDNELLMTVLTMFRNLSCDPSFETMMCCSGTFMMHIMVLLRDTSSEPRLSEMHLFAMDILSNIAGRIDLTGRKREPASAFLEDMLAPDFPGKERVVHPANCNAVCCKPVEICGEGPFCFALILCGANLFRRM